MDPIGKNTMAGRLSGDLFPSLALPLSLSGIGRKTMNAGVEEFKPGIHNPFVEVVWGLSGVGEVTLWERRFQMQPGDVFYYLPDEDHRLCALSEAWHSRWIAFDGPLAEATMAAYRFPRHQSVVRPFPEELFREMEEHVSSADPFWIRTMASHCLAFLAHMGGDTRAETNQWHIQTCLALIRANLANPALDVAMLCEHLNLHRTTLTRLFREKLHRSPATYIRDLRYERARALLGGSRLPISEVAKRCGFAQTGSFSRLIRRATGLSPSDYRQKRGDNLL